MKNALDTIALFLGYGMLLGFVTMLLIFGPSIYRYLRDDLQSEWLFWAQRRVTRWYTAKRDQIEGLLIIALSLGLVWLGLVISSPAQ